MKNKRNLVQLAFDYHKIVILVVSCLIAFGIYSLDGINKNEFPNFTIRQGIVAAVYPGKSAEEIEMELTKPLEKYIFSFKEVKKSKTKSFSRDGMCIIQIELNDDIGDKDTFWNKFKHGINTFKSSLPKGVLAVRVIDDFGDTSALLIAMESSDKTYKELDEYMKALEDRLYTIESVGRLNVIGKMNEQISIYLDNKRLASYGINDKIIAVNLLNNGFTTMAGSVKDNSSEMPVYVTQSLNVVSDVENMTVYSDIAGNQIRIKDIAKVKKEYPKPDSYITNNGTKCLVLSIEMKEGRNIVKMGQDVKKILAEFENELPQSVKMTTITDQPKVVNDSVWTFLKELLIAIGAVILVVLLLMPMRVALVAASTIPITIFISLGLFNFFDVELNTVTLAALIVTLGMIVDNSIVIIDAYVEQLKEGADRKTAAVQSATHFFKSILSATLAISVTFFPFLITMKGVMHDFLESFPWAVTLILFVSLLVAELLVPFMQYKFITAETLSQKKKLTSQNNLLTSQNNLLTSQNNLLTSQNNLTTSQNNLTTSQNKFNFLDFIQTFYDKLITACFSHKMITIFIGVISIFFGALLLLNHKQQLMPAADRDQFAVEIYLPTGASLERTTAIADSLEKILLKDKRITSICSFKGMSSPRFQAGYAPQFADKNYAQFIVNTKGIRTTVELLDEYTDKYQTYFPDAYVKFKQIMYGDASNPIEVRVSGVDLMQIKKAVDTITLLMRQNENLTLVRNDFNEYLPAVDIDLNESKSQMMGISPSTLQLTLAMRYNSSGLPLAEIYNNDYKTPICLKSITSDSNTTEDLKSELIPVAGGLTNVPLRSISDINTSYHYGQISRRGGVRTATVLSEVKRGENTAAVFDALIAQLNKISLPEGVSITYGGDYESNEDNMPKIIGGLIIAVVIIFFILVFHFKKLSLAFLLLCSLLLTLLGASVGMIIAGVDLSITCFLGIIALMGILVRNAIIMYDYAIELQHKDNLPPQEAIFLSAKRRMRPIFLTSAAASMGVIPMILGKSSLWMPMGAVICYGTILTMFFILTVLPVAYALINKKTK